MTVAGGASPAGRDSPVARGTGMRNTGDDWWPSPRAPDGSYRSLRRARDESRTAPTPGDPVDRRPPDPLRGPEPAGTGGLSSTTESVSRTSPHGDATATFSPTAPLTGTGDNPSESAIIEDPAGEDRFGGRGGKDPI